MRLLGAVKAQQCPQGHLAPGMSAKAPFCGKSCLLAGQESAWAYKNWKSELEKCLGSLEIHKDKQQRVAPSGFCQPHGESWRWPQLSGTS